MVVQGLPKEAACSSPFAITDYSCHKDFGGDEALARLRDRVHAKGMRLLVDFVPNHMAVRFAFLLSFFFSACCVVAFCVLRMVGVLVSFFGGGRV